tara:strand:+ start:6053 stop:7807 length:1755 start_codon:yes stop_codon:yes gene_type:complete
MSRINLIYKNLLFLITRNNLLSSLIIVLTVLASFADLLSITMAFPVIQAILYNGENILFSNYLTFFNNYDPDLKIKLILIIFVGVLIFKNLILIFKSFLTLEYEYKLINSFASRISKKIIFSEHKEFSKMDNNQIFNLLNKEIKISIRCVRAFFNFLTDILFLIITVIFAIFFSKYILIVLISIFTFLIPPIVYYLYKYSLSNSSARLKISDSLSKDYRNLLDGLKVIKIFNLSNIFMTNLNQSLEKNKKVHRNFLFLTENLRTFFEIILAIFLFTIVLLYLSKYDGEKLLLSIPFFSTLFILILKVVTTAIKVIKNGMYVINLSSSTNRLIDIYKNINQKDQILINRSDQISKKKFERNIKFKNLSFSYDDKNLIFNNINFNINKSDKIIISGPSGSGKSTLVELLTGLNLPNSGKILIDDIDLSNCNKKDWLNAIGFVGQKNTLFNKSIKENILDGCQNASNEMYKKALKISRTYDFLIENKISDEEVITQGQENFSGGQLKRISIARALVKNPMILILDEATNEFDELLEKKIISDIIKYYQNITIIFISHNLDNKKFCNRSLIIKNQNLNEEKDESLLSD